MLHLLSSCSHKDSSAHETVLCMWARCRHEKQVRCHRSKGQGLCLIHVMQPMHHNMHSECKLDKQAYTDVTTEQKQSTFAVSWHKAFAWLGWTWYAGCMLSPVHTMRLQQKVKPLVPSVTASMKGTKCLHINCAGQWKRSCQSPPHDRA